MSDTKQLRQKAVRARNALTPKQQQRYSDIIVDKILESPEYRDAEVIMMYRGVAGEVNLDRLLALEEAHGKTLVFPYCRTKTEMIALKPREDNAWRAGSFDIPEPVPEASDEFDPATIDLILNPLAAFDEDCNRIGMGAGYYDRFLPKAENAYVLAVAFEAQKVAKIDPEPWDVPMDSVMTEKTRYRRD